MLKYIGFGIIAISTFAAITNGSKLGSYTSSSTAREPINVEKFLTDEAQKLNRSKGKQQGHSTFVGATVNGKTLHHQYEVNLPVERINTSVIADEFEKNSKSLACKGPFRRLLDEGATLEYSYRTAHRKNFIFEARINARTCKA